MNNKKIFILEDRIEHYREIQSVLNGNGYALDYIFPSDTKKWEYSSPPFDYIEDFHRTEFDFIKRIFTFFNADPDKLDIKEIFTMILYKYNNIDIFLIDIELSDGDKYGLEFVDFLKKSKYPYKKVVLITSYSQYDLNITSDVKLIPKSQIRVNLINIIND